MSMASGNVFHKNVKKLRKTDFKTSKLRDVTK